MYKRQLVAYIHLNPVRAGIVEDITVLKTYFFTGHSALMGGKARPWQDTEYVLALFGRTVLEARRNLHSHLMRWSAKGNWPEFMGGGLIRSAGGWHAVKEAYRDGIRLAGDERILGSSEFVESTLKGAGEAYERRMQLQSAGRCDRCCLPPFEGRREGTFQPDKAGADIPGTRIDQPYCHPGFIDLRKPGGRAAECRPFSY